MFNLTDFYNTYEIYLYSFQQQVYVILSLQNRDLIVAKLISLFCVGVFTSLNPCFLSILPLSFSYLSYRENNILNKNIFILGLLSSFILLISLLSFFNYHIHTFILNIPVFSDLILIFISLNLLEIFDLSFLFFFIKSTENISFRNIFFQMYLVGFIVGLSSMPCNSSFILTIIFWLSSSGSLLQSLLYLFIYLFGFIVPLFLIFNLSLINIKRSIFISLWNKLIPLSSFFILSMSLFSLLDQIFINYMKFIY